MSTEVNWKELFSNRKNVFSCKTEKEAKQLLRIAHDLGYTWRIGASFLTETNWNVYKNETSYAIGSGTYSRDSFYSGEGYTVYEFSKLIKQINMKKGFTKQEFLDKKVAIEWQDEKAKEINAFLQECNTDNNEVVGLAKYYFTDEVSNPGYFTSSNSVEDLKSKGITRHYTIDRLIKEGAVMKEATTQTISRENLGKIYPLVCSKWQGRIDVALNKDKFAVNIEVDEDLIKQAFSEADRTQTAILEKYFKQPKVGFQAKDLEIGEIMKVTKDIVIKGKHIMRVYDKLVCLESPDQTWSDPNINTIEGIKLEKGTKFTLTAK